MDWQNLAITAVIQSGIGLLFWLLIQRQVEKFDRVEQRVKHLEERRISGIECMAKEENEKNAARRKEIYERLAKVERESVTIDKCHESHKEMLGGMQEYRIAVIDLAKTQEKLDSTARFVNEVNQRVINLAEDVARMEGANGRG
jgi:hypothetical protein